MRSFIGAFAIVFISPFYAFAGVTTSSSAPVGHFLAQMPQAMHLKGSVCLSPSKNIEADGQNPTHIRHEVHLSLRTCTTPLASRSSACVGHTPMQAPHCVQILILAKPAILTTLTRDNSGEFSLKYAFEHASIHAPHWTHFSALTCMIFTQNPSTVFNFFKTAKGRRDLWQSSPILELYHKVILFCVILLIFVHASCGKKCGTNARRAAGSVGHGSWPLLRGPARANSRKRSPPATAPQAYKIDCPAFAAWGPRCLSSRRVRENFFTEKCGKVLQSSWIIGRITYVVRNVSGWRNW